MLSLIIPVKNQWFYTAQILKDIQKKVKENYEVIIIDDNSTDETPQKLKEYPFLENVYYISHYENIGVNKAWNE